MKKIAFLVVFVLVLSLSLYAVDNSEQLLKELGIKMVLIPDGNIEMMNTEVTQRTYEMITGNNPSKIKGELFPVSNIGWYDAVEFCNALSKKFGYTLVYEINGENTKMNDSADGFRLPTGKEWEYAARGGEKYTYAGSDNLSEVAWYRDNSNHEPFYPVAKKKPNRYGLYDICGNVSEWCWDCPTPDLPMYRLLLGGDTRSDSSSCEISYKNYGEVNERFGNYGFRIVRNK